MEYAKEVVWGTFITPNAYIRKEERPQINELSNQNMKVEWEYQNKCEKVEVRNIYQN